ncbi:glycosyl transferase, group 2 family protein [Synechococcus sp. PCC 7335]|uniref:glycosyltransferase family 2 protein n=1 Tax=Synechococcus sp. (strain ATCC 29403 / PCC 7335) TaxID=91464 RepID=UPI00017EDC66|nr:glycosyltransferase [Synechococcus sp. PCC 7335]EDX87725.1 glycosyl transferase, group 2 family protein [Synechococcus sp. PCC 7335]
MTVTDTTFPKTPPLSTRSGSLSELALPDQKPKVTLVIGPRERFSYTQACLESIYQNTDYPFELVFVDVCSPRPVARYIQQKARQESFKVIRTERYLSPNQARNVGLRQVLTQTDSDYVVFVENDVVVKNGWLTKLVSCAEQTGAAVVGPLTCIGKPLHQVIHNAGGRSYIQTDFKRGQPRRKIKQSAYLTGRPVAEVPEELRPVQCDYVEFHCMLARTSLFETAPFKQTGGLLDEGMLATREHIDFCFMVTEAGGKIYSDRTAVVTTDTVGIDNNKVGLIQWFGQLKLPEFKLYDLPYFMLRWSDAWDLASLNHLRQKWDLTEDKYFKKRYAKLGARRRELLVLPLVDRLTCGRGSDRLENLLAAIERKINHYLYGRYLKKHPETPHPIQSAAVRHTLQAARQR